MNTVFHTELLVDYPNILHVGVMRRLTPSRSKQVCHQKELLAINVSEMDFSCFDSSFTLFIPSLWTNPVNRISISFQKLMDFGKGSRQVGESYIAQKLS